MKIRFKKIISLVMVVCMMFVMTSLSTMAESTTEKIYSVSEPYEYAMTQDSDEWKMLETTEARRAAFSVPDEVISKMTTEALLETVINNPYFADIWAFDSVDIGIEIVSNYVDGLAELVERADFEEVVAAMNSEVATMTFSGENNELSMLKRDLMTQVCITSNESFGNAVTPRATAVTIRTPYGSAISAYKGYTYADHGMTQSYARTEQASLLANYPSATIIRNVSASAAAYNCHSYAWYSTSSTNDYWFDNPTKYMTDGSYSPSTTSVGDKVYWKSGSSPVHSGIVYSVSGSSVVVTSKWGPFGLIRHNVNDCPFNYASWSTYD